MNTKNTEITNDEMIDIIKMSNSESILMMELTQLERDLENHEAYLKRGWLSPEGYKKWYSRKRSLIRKIERRKVKIGIFMDDNDFKNFYEPLSIEDNVGYTIEMNEKFQSRFTRHQQNMMNSLLHVQHSRNSNYY